MSRVQVRFFIRRTCFCIGRSIAHGILVKNLLPANLPILPGNVYVLYKWLIERKAYPFQVRYLCASVFTTGFEVGAIFGIRLVGGINYGVYLVA